MTLVKFGPGQRRNASVPPGRQTARSYQGETGSDASRARADAGAPKSDPVPDRGAPASSRAPSVSWELRVEHRPLPPCVAGEWVHWLPHRTSFPHFPFPRPPAADGGKGSEGSASVWRANPIHPWRTATGVSRMVRGAVIPPATDALPSFGRAVSRSGAASRKATPPRTPSRGGLSSGRPPPGVGTRRGVLTARDGHES